MIQNNMKASELQIGDYVKCCDFLVETTRIDEHSASGIELVTLTPIPWSLVSCFF